MVRWPFRKRKYKRLEDVPSDELARVQEEAIIEKKERERHERVEAKAREMLEEEEARKRAEELRKNDKDKSTTSSLVVNAVTKNPHWFALLLLLILVIIIGISISDSLRDLLKLVVLFLMRFIVPIIIVLLFIIIIIRGFRDKDPASKWIAGAFLIWVIDMLPAEISFFGFTTNLPSRLLGAPYAGFEFDLQGTLDTNWIALLTSTTFIIIIVLGFINDAVRKNVLTLPLYFVILIIINNFTENFALRFQTPLLNYIALVMIIITFFFAFRYREKLREKGLYDFPTFLFMALVVSFFSVNNGWLANRRAWFHIFYIFMFGLFYVRKREPDNPSAWHLTIPLLLIADFYLYNFMWLLSNELEGLQFVPILVLAVILYCLDKTESNYAGWAIGFIVALIVLSALPAYTIDTGTIEYKAKRGYTFKEFTSQFADKIREIIEGRLDIATAGLYRGNVEKNRYESLGVYFSNIRAADPKFYVKEPITVWGSIRSKTYKDAVVINFDCYRWKNNKKIKADRKIPNIKFPIFTLEEIDTECVFSPTQEKNKEFNVGSNIITFSADYNFGTDAYLKVYFMDRDRYRAYTREDIEPLTEFGVKDKNPSAVFTNGPVEIGMSTGQPLITVSRGYAIKPTIGITLTNRKEIQDKDKKIFSKWDGKIKQITELVLLLPHGIKLHNDDEPDSLKRYCTSNINEEKIKCPCSMPFYRYTKDDCKTSCTKQVLKPCEEACGVSNTDADEKKTCNNECGTAKDNCESDCELLFQVSEGEGDKGEEYKGYALDIESKEFKELNKDIDKHRSFMCRLEPTEDVLDNTPITTRYFRVRARYNYSLENSVTVNVEELPLEYADTVPDWLYKTALEPGPYPDIYFPGYSPDLISAIALVESRWRHCCPESGTCKVVDESSCENNRVFTSYDGSSVGIMQINVKCDGCPARNKKLEDAVCNGKTIYDRECNIRVGKEILRDNFNKYKGGINVNVLQQICNKERHPDRFQKYLSYEDIRAAIRAYNGWGCSPESSCNKACAKSRNPTKCVQDCISGTVDYVEKVLEKWNKIKEGVIIDTSNIAEALASEDVISVHEEGTQDVLIPETHSSEAIQQILPPTNAKAIDTPYRSNSISISWTASTTPNVNYLVYQYEQQTDINRNIYTTANTEYVDTNVDNGVNYYYRITAYNDFGESNYAKTSIVASIDDRPP